MKRIYLFTLGFTCLCVSCSLAQENFVVEKVSLVETVDHRYKSVIPRLKDTLQPDNPVVIKINEVLLTGL